MQKARKRGPFLVDFPERARRFTPELPRTRGFSVGEAVAGGAARQLLVRDLAALLQALEQGIEDRLGGIRRGRELDDAHTGANRRERAARPPGWRRAARALRSSGGGSRRCGVEELAMLRAARRQTPWRTGLP